MGICPTVHRFVSYDHGFVAGSQDHPGHTHKALLLGNLDFAVVVNWRAGRNVFVPHQHPYTYTTYFQVSKFMNKTLDPEEMKEINDRNKKKASELSKEAMKG
eukprot:5672750-Pyramimonas_sp.AAC.1